MKHTDPPMLLHFRCSLTSLSDGDGDVDLLIGSATGEIYYYENRGTPTDPKFTRVEQNEAENPFYNSMDGIDKTATGSAPTLADVNNDGIIDLLVGDSAGFHGFFDASYCEHPNVCNQRGHCDRITAIGAAATLNAAGCSCSDGYSGDFCSACSAGSTEQRFPSTASFQKEPPLVCLLCPSGYWSNLTNNVRVGCTACSAGRYSELYGAFNATDCIACPAGFSTSGERARDRCDRCARGEFASTVASETCGSCSVNSFADKKNSTLCRQCPIGWSTDADGSAKCTKCGAGSYGKVQGEACAPCESGFYRNGSDPITDNCRPCPVGTYQDSTGNAACLPCLPGQMGNATGCHDCPQGKVSRKAGASNCADCDAGRSTGTTGSAKCTNCEAGTYSSTVGQECQACMPGQYRSSKDAAGVDTDPTSCQACKPGFYQDSERQASCLPWYVPRHSFIRVPLLQSLTLFFSCSP